MSHQLSSQSSGDEGRGLLRVEVVFALPERQELITVLLDRGSTVADAIARWSIAMSQEKSNEETLAGWDIDRCAVGVWGHPVGRDQPLQDGDRVEIYRPLRIDPRDERRALAAQGRSMGKSGIDIEKE